MVSPTEGSGLFSEKLTQEWLVLNDPALDYSNGNKNMNVKETYRSGSLLHSLFLSSVTVLASFESSVALPFQALICFC